MHRSFLTRPGAAARGVMTCLCAALILLLAPLSLVVGDQAATQQPLGSPNQHLHNAPAKPMGNLLADKGLSQLHRHDALDGLVIDARPAVHAERGAVGSVRVVDAETGAAWLHLRSERLNDFFGYATTWLGDINGDGWPDLAIGIPNAADPLRLERRGIVRIVSGLDGSTLREIEGTPGDVFGVNLAAIEHAQHELPLLAVQWRRQNADGGVERGGDLYDVLSGERVDGVIDAQTLATGRTGIAWRYHEDRLHGGIAGDFNGDGLVDLADFQILIDAVGTEIEIGADAAMADDPMLALGLIGDLNRDGVVDGTDLQLFAGVLEGMGEDGELDARNSPLPPPCVFPCGDLEPSPGGPDNGAGTGEPGGGDGGAGPGSGDFGNGSGGTWWGGGGDPCDPESANHDPCHPNCNPECNPDCEEYEECHANCDPECNPNCEEYDPCNESCEDHDPCNPDCADCSMQLRKINRDFHAVNPTWVQVLKEADFQGNNHNYVVYGGSEESTSDSLRLTASVNLSGGDCEIIEYRWSVSGPGSHHYTPPTTKTWEIDQVHAQHGILTFRCEVISDGGTVCTIEEDVEIGIRTDDVIVIGWINPNGVPIPAILGNVDPNAVQRFPPNGPPVPDVPEATYVMFRLSMGDTAPKTAPIIGDTIDLIQFPDTRQYLLHWLFRYAANPDPTGQIPGGDFRHQTEERIDNIKVDQYLQVKTNYKLFNRLQIRYRVASGGNFTVYPHEIHSVAWIGSTTNPLGGLWNFVGPIPGQPGWANGKKCVITTGLTNRYIHINDGSPDGNAIATFNTLLGAGIQSPGTPVYWENIGSQIRFSANGSTQPTVTVQPFPTYYEYRNGQLVQVHQQAPSPSANFFPNPYPFGAGGGTDASMDPALSGQIPNYVFDGMLCP